MAISLNHKAKPFLKWAGGKTQLLPALDASLPSDFDIVPHVYIEPFVGGGAMLFHMLQKYPGISRGIINDINLHLIKTYLAIKNSPEKLISKLAALEEKYQRFISETERRDFFLAIREEFNNSAGMDDVDEASYMIFLNRTCYNGLYRENSRGGFNVPFGRYANPRICDAKLIEADSLILQKVVIIHGDFYDTRRWIERNTFFYFDPPYRPLNATSSFNSYVKEKFNDDEQIRLKKYFDEVSDAGCKALLSNSDGKSANCNDTFMEELYSDYIIERVTAKRNINAVASRRGNLTELLIRNYNNTLSPTAV